MRKILIILTLVAILLQACNGGVIYLGFAINQDYIAKYLCVQQDVKDNHCKGSCHLKKKLKETHSDNPSQLPEALRNTFAPLFWEDLQAQGQLLLTHGQTDLQRYIIEDLSKEDQALGHGIFHPPLQA